MIKQRTKEKGFILLMSSIVVSAILVAVVFSLSFAGFFTRFNLLDSYNKETSLRLAQACSDIAVLKRIQNVSYHGDETIAIGSETCQILALELSGSEKIIKTTANKGGAISNIQVNLDLATLLVNRRREVAQF
jgi:hypothetical protein